MSTSGNMSKEVVESSSKTNTQSKRILLPDVFRRLLHHF